MTGAAGLTEKQAALLRFIQSRGVVSPSVSEMCSALGTKSRGGIQQMLANLECRGWIRRLPNRHRAIELLRPVPESTAPTAYTGPYPIRGHGTCADWTESDAEAAHVAHMAHVRAVESAVSQRNLTVPDRHESRGQR